MSADANPADLCAVCVTALRATPAIFRDDYDDLDYTDRAIEHHSSLHELRAASDHGCPACTWLWLRVRDCITDFKLGDDVEVTSELRSPALRGFYELPEDEDVEEDDDDDDDYGSIDDQQHAQYTNNSMTVYFWATIGAQDQHPDGVRSFGRDVSIVLTPVDHGTRKVSHIADLNTGSNATLDLAKKWLELCSLHHPLCNQQPATSWRPTRLIHIQTSESGLAACLREASRDEYELDVRYMTMSHRWFPDALTLLSKATLPSFREKIPLENLKTSVRDAMIVAQHLGVPYLWVDSLCIVQDDPDELGSEIMAMDRVYGNSFCNISAASEKDSAAGLFFERDTRHCTTYSTTLDLSHTLPIAPTRHSISVSWDVCAAELGESSLGSRAWVFQERILSRRNLYFCSRELHWECREAEACETYPNGEPTSSECPNTLPIVDVIREADSAHQKELALEMWPSLVSAYANCQMSFSMDRLRALSGVASFCSSFTGDQYLFGHWRTSLPESLLWRVPENVTEALALPHVAPSWSWAHVTGLIFLDERFRIYGLERWAEFKQYIIRDDPDPSKAALNPLGAMGGARGQLISPTLHLTGRLWTATVLKSLYVAEDRQYPSLEQDALKIHGSRSLRLVHIRLDLPMGFPFEATFLPIAGKRTPENNIIFAQEDGLVLRRVSESWLEQSSIPYFRRVGVYGTIDHVPTESNEPNVETDLYLI